MRLYFAGNGYGSVPDKEKEFLENLGAKYKLYSYHNEPKKAMMWGSEGMMLDSGAFSAWSRGVEIDIDEFIEFVQLVEPERTIQLDVIGDEGASWKNWKYLDDHIDTMPVIHYNASTEQIKRVCDVADYICFGALVPFARRKKELCKWLDYLFTFKEIREKRIHCLGIMTPEILMRYPFYSADSTSALRLVRFPTDNILLKYRQKRNDRNELLTYGVQEQLKLQKFVTELWKIRLSDA